MFVELISVTDPLFTTHTVLCLSLSLSPSLPLSHSCIHSFQLSDLLLGFDRHYCNWKWPSHSISVSISQSGWLSIFLFLFMPLYYCYLYKLFYLFLFISICPFTIITNPLQCCSAHTPWVPDPLFPINPYLVSPLRQLHSWGNWHRHPNSRPVGEGVIPIRQERSHLVFYVQDRLGI